MAAFSAINVEPEESIDEEIDTTKDIQVDDALKLFQHALKLHAQGPRFFDQASGAYDTLFESEIFKYPESKTDYERNEAGQDGTLATEPAFSPILDVVGTDGDGIASSLPQALYLSYKNHGQFVIDRIRHKAHATSTQKDALVQDPAVQDDARRALDDFCVALDHDPSDAELWRKSARVAAFLTSARINRYSLEAAIELDDDPAVEEVEPPSLAEGFAGEQLKQQLQILGDEMALSHPAMKPFLDKEMPPYLTRFLDPIPFLPNPTKHLAIPKPDAGEIDATRLVVPISGFLWADLGTALVRLVTEEGFSGRPVSIRTLDRDGEDDIQMELDLQLQPPKSPSPANKPSEIVPLKKAATEQPADEEAVVEEPKSADAESTPINDQPTKERSIPMPSRKRSQSAAGIPDAIDDEAADLKRSKRTRRRDTAAEEIMDSATLLATQLQPLQAADQNLFQTTKNLLENLGVTDRMTLERIAEVLDTCASDDRTGKIQNQATVDLRDSITHFDEDTATVLLSKRELPQLSLSAFLEHAKSGSQRAHEAPAFDDARNFKNFVETVNDGWNTIHDVAYEYVKDLAKTYTDSKWPDHLRTTVTQVISTFDGSIYERVVHELESSQGMMEGEAFAELANLAQVLFELHLDAYERITNPNSAVDQGTMLETRGRLDRWMDLVTAITKLRNPEQGDALSLRFLWAAVSSTTLVKGTSRDHVLNCWHSLRDFLAKSPGADINLPNNVIMPEISTAAAEREISKLTTMDFFLGLFQEDMSDPVSVIESLEPVLSPEGVHIIVPAPPEPNGDDSDTANPKHHKQLPITECASQELLDLWKFLKSSSTELRLLLWSRLGEAYGTIQYTTKQFSCFLRSIETIIADFEGDQYINTPTEPRRALFMSMLKALDDLIIQSLHLALNNNSSFDIVDEDHLRSSMSALAKVSCLLHAAAMYEDETRIGITPAPSSSSTLRSFLNKLQEMQVRTWSLQYTMLKVGIYQHSDIFPKPENDLADYLAAVHQVLGLRKCCKSSNKIFLKMMRVELLKQKNIENWEDYLGQVLYDLHGLKLGVGIWEVQDHGCEPENLEKRQALQLVEKVAMLANRMSMKDLLKSDLKTTIERMQQAIGSAKSSPQMAHNLRNYSEYLKAPIHPLHLYQALTGSVDLDAVSINTAESAPAKQGWFFLLGMIALTKFKGVDLNRRMSPGATDDLRIGATFLRLQLQYTPDRWEAWFRLAECFDYELDEAVLWTADKMNKERAELVKFQRHAIHSYTMALSHSYAWALLDRAALTSLEDDGDALYDMYRKFGMRMYSSSREPFAMEPFQHSDHKRFFIETEGSGTYKKILHTQMTDYQVWNFAAHLFRKAMVGKPKDWKIPYMVAKCLWKMYQKAPEELDEKNQRHHPTVQKVINALEKTIEVVSELPKPRHGQDPILEPHYKIVSVVHKLVTRGDLRAQEGANILQRQPYAPDRGKELTIDTDDDWEPYVIRCLRFLRDKDKSNWQHRLIIRHARVLFDKDGDDSNNDSTIAARAAFAVLRENMLTKTMAMNIWKCEAERPGRHHVYTERYIRYIVRLLAVMNDRVNLESLLRRIRKKSIDFYHFNELWQFCVVTYVKLLRQTFNIAVTEEDVFKSLNQEEFDVVGEKVTDWATTTDAEPNTALGAMKEAVEIKKLNANLMKAGPIDDLITDCYAAIYLHLRPDLPGPRDETPKPDDTTAATADLLKSKLLHGLVTRDKEPPSVLGSLRAASEQPDRDKSAAHSVAGDGAAPRASHHRVGGGIRRPNILRKAEQAVQAVLRAAEAQPKSGAANGAGGTKSRVGSISSARGRKAGGSSQEEEGGSGEETEEEEEQSQHGEEGEDVEMKDADGHAEDGSGGHKRRGSVVAAVAVIGGGGGGGGEADSEISSPPGSVHDSADDESDLSDVPADYEDDVPPSLLFPNLRRSVDAGVAAGAGVDTGGESSGESEAGDEGVEGEEDVETEVEGEVEGEEEVEEEGEEGVGEDVGEDEHDEEGADETEDEHGEETEGEGDGGDAGSPLPQPEVGGEEDMTEEEEDE